MSRRNNASHEKSTRITPFDYEDEEVVRRSVRKRDPEKERLAAEFRRRNLELERALTPSLGKQQDFSREKLAGLDMSEEARRASLVKTRDISTPQTLAQRRLEEQRIREAEAEIDRAMRREQAKREQRRQELEQQQRINEIRERIWSGEEIQQHAQKQIRDYNNTWSRIDHADQRNLRMNSRLRAVDSLSRLHERLNQNDRGLALGEDRLLDRLHQRADRDYERQAVPIIEIDEPILPGSIEYRSRETVEPGHARRTELMQELTLTLDRPYSVVREGKNTIGRSGYEIYILPPTKKMPDGKMVFVNDTSGNAAIVIHRLAQPEELVGQADWRQFASRTKNDLKALQAVGLASVIDRYTSADSWVAEMQGYLEQPNDPDHASLNIDQLCNQEMTTAPSNYLTRNEINLLFPSWNLHRLIKEIDIVLHEPEMTQRTDQPLTGWYNEKTRARVNFHYHQSVADRLREKFPPVQERPKNSLALKELTRQLQGDPEIAEFAKEGLPISFPTVYTVIADLIIQHPAWEVNCLGAGPEGTVAVYTAEALTSIKEEIVKYLKQRKIEKADILFPERPSAIDALPPGGAMTKGKIAEKFDIADAGVDRAIRLQLGQGRMITDLGNYFRGPKKSPAWYYYGHTINDIAPKLTIPYAGTGDEIETTLLARLKISSMVLTRNLRAIAVERSCLTKDLWQEKKDPQNKMPKDYLPREVVARVEEKIK